MSEKSSYIAEDQVSPLKTDSNIKYRIGCGIAASACLITLAFAAWANPDPRGHGTHTQLGMPVCGFLERTGYPCVTCGMTTAFSHVVRGQILQAFVVQPAGALLAISCMFTLALGSLATLTGKGQNQLNHLLNKLCLHWAGVLMIVVAVVLGSWLFKCILTYSQTH
ncbi:MAG: DUF2752 domain-containing protein [Planctomycetes bacterium]|nr:DUF2752 domain-containing protein [Planctomycetota bacterium]